MEPKRFKLPKVLYAAVFFREYAAVPSFENKQRGFNAQKKPCTYSPAELRMILAGIDKIKAEVEQMIHEEKYGFMAEFFDPKEKYDSPNQNLTTDKNVTFA